MKIEKVSENQIRCTLTREDLEDREIKISELAYGTEKARNLFRDMIDQAAAECGFEVDDIPIMIEAIPVSPEGIVLLITKVEDPEELDTRFSQFAPSIFGKDEEAGDVPVPTASDILDLCQKIREKIMGSTDSATPSPAQNTGLPQPTRPEKRRTGKARTEIPASLSKIYCFEDLEDVINLAHVLRDYFTGQNDLYKDSGKNSYYLYMDQGGHSPDEFNRVCNTSSEYARDVTASPISQAYLQEHCESIIKERALQMLFSI